MTNVLSYLVLDILAAPTTPVLRLATLVCVNTLLRAERDATENMIF